MHSQPDITDVVAKGEPIPTPISMAANMEVLKAEEGQIDLIDKCRMLLVQHGIKEQALANYDSDNGLNVAKVYNTATQRVALNQFWHLQLSPFGHLSHAVRFKLIDNGSALDWLRLFEQGVADFIIANDLPVKYA